VPGPEEGQVVGDRAAEDGEDFAAVGEAEREALGELLPGADEAAPLSGVDSIDSAVAPLLPEPFIR
jgi:hypothetical protein